METGGRDALSFKAVELKLRRFIQPTSFHRVNIRSLRWPKRGTFILKNKRNGKVKLYYCVVKAAVIAYLNETVWDLNDGTR
jgi:hypothetical protein